MLEDVGCPNGCDRDDVHVLTGRDLLHGLPGEFHVVRCRSCGLLRTNPRPAAESMGMYYPDDYGPYASAGPATAQGPDGGLRRFAKWLSRQVLLIKPHHIPDLAPGRMLEIGCASGRFLDEMARKGWKVAGLEFSNTAADAARRLGYEVQTASMESAAAPACPYDLVVGWMVLEHLHDPVGSLRKLRDWTEPGGWLVLSVPDAGSIEFHVFKKWWYGLHLPNHLFHYKPRTLSHLLESTGWRVRRRIWHRNPNNLLLSLSSWCRRRSYGRTARYLQEIATGQRVPYFRAFLGLALGLFRQSGRMTVWAQRT
jgi:SAM-dependent methyltransferase